MMRRIVMVFVAACALGALARPRATSQEQTPAVPSKQTPPVAAALGETPPGVPLIDGLIERTAHTTAPAADSPLHELDWMVGEWVDQDAEATNESAVKWTKNGAFLIRSFRISTAAGDPLTGMQVIAWDPAEKHFRSWTFDSRGGFGEESWTRAGDRWSMRTKYTLPDGGRASAVHVMTRLDDDTFRWKSVNRVIDGSLEPDIDEVTFVRFPREALTPTPEPTTIEPPAEPKQEVKP
jgi:hypothetical protein